MMYAPEWCSHRVGRHVTPYIKGSVVETDGSDKLNQFCRKGLELGVYDVIGSIHGDTSLLKSKL